MIKLAEGTWVLRRTLDFAGDLPQGKVVLAANSKNGGKTKVEGIMWA